MSSLLTMRRSASIIPTLDSLYSELGLRLRAARSRAGLSQEALAHRVGLRRTSIANIERGTQRVQIHTLYALAEATQTDIQELLPSPENANSSPDLFRSLPSKDRKTIEALTPADLRTLE